MLFGVVFLLNMLPYVLLYRLTMNQPLHLIPDKRESSKLELHKDGLYVHITGTKKGTSSEYQYDDNDPNIDMNLKLTNQGVLIPPAKETVGETMKIQDKSRNVIKKKLDSVSEINPVNQEYIENSKSTDKKSQNDTTNNLNALQQQVVTNSDKLNRAKSLNEKSEEINKIEQNLKENLVALSKLKTEAIDEEFRLKEQGNKENAPEHPSPLATTNQKVANYVNISQLNDLLNQHATQSVLTTGKETSVGQHVPDKPNSEKINTPSGGHIEDLQNKHMSPEEGKGTPENLNLPQLINSNTGTTPTTTSTTPTTSTTTPTSTTTTPTITTTTPTTTLPTTTPPTTTTSATTPTTTPTTPTTTPIIQTTTIFPKKTQEMPTPPTPPNNNPTHPPSAPNTKPENSPDTDNTPTDPNQAKPVSATDTSKTEPEKTENNENNDKSESIEELTKKLNEVLGATGLNSGGKKLKVLLVGEDEDHLKISKSPEIHIAGQEELHIPQSTVITTEQHNPPANGVQHLTPQHIDAKIEPIQHITVPNQNNIYHSASTGVLQSSPCESMGNPNIYDLSPPKHVYGCPPSNDGVASKTPPKSHPHIMHRYIHHYDNDDDDDDDDCCARNIQDECCATADDTKHTPHHLRHRHILSNMRPEVHYHLHISKDTSKTLATPSKQKSSDPLTKDPAEFDDLEGKQEQLTKASLLNPFIGQFLPMLKHPELTGYRKSLDESVIEDPSFGASDVRFPNVEGSIASVIHFKRNKALHYKKSKKKNSQKGRV